MEKVEQRVALVTGATGGIGAAVVERLRADGLLVYAGSRRHNQDSVCEVKLDVSNSERCTEVCEEIYSAHGHLDVLVNCAAITCEAPALALTDDEWDKVIDVDLTGTFRTCRAAAKYMLLGRWGRIINFSSIAASFGGRGQVNYVAAKSGVEALSRSLALELGRKGVLVNCVAPGVIDTRMSSRIRESHADELRGAIAVRRFGEAVEMAAIVSFLASDDSSYITGQVIHADGGMGL